MERIGYQGIQLLIQIILARLLAPADFGLIAILLVFVNIGNVFVRSGFNTALVQNPTVTEDDYSTVFWISLVISLFVYTILFCSAPLIASFYNKEILGSMLRVIGLVFIIDSYNSVQVAEVMKTLSFKSLFRATIFSVVVSGFIGIVMAYCNCGVWALVLQQLLYQFANCLYLTKYVNWKPKMVLNFKRAKLLFGFGSKLLFSSLLDTGYQGLSSLLIGKVFTPSELGIITQGSKYPQALGYMLDGSIQPVILPAVSSIQDDLIGVKLLVRKALTVSTFIIFPAMCLFALISDNLIPLLLGEQWVQSIYFLKIYCFVYALLPIHTTNLQALNGMGRSDIFLKLELVKKTIGCSVLLFCTFKLRSIKAIALSYLFTGILATFINEIGRAHV